MPRRSCARPSRANQRDPCPRSTPRSIGVLEAAGADLEGVGDYFVRRSVWIVGGNGSAYDVGSGGSTTSWPAAHDVNVLVLDTEVYSNTDEPDAKATPLGAAAKFAAAGKTTPKKDLALQAIAYGNVYGPGSRWAPIRSRH